MPLRKQNIPSDDRRCTHANVAGSRCRYPRLEGHSLCGAHHFDAMQKAEKREPFPAFVAAEILPPEAKLDSAAAVNSMLTRVARCLLEARLSPRHAASLGYLGQLLISTLPGIERAAANQPPHSILGHDPDAALVKILHSLAEPGNSLHRALPAEPPAPPQKEAANGQAEKAG